MHSVTVISEVSTHWGLSLHMQDMTYPSAKPISGISVATVRTSGMKIIHNTSLTAKPARMDRTTLQTMRMPSPTCGGDGGASQQVDSNST